MVFKMEHLEHCIIGAMECKYKYIGIKVVMKGFEKPEIIINERENFESKLRYYKTAYDENLYLKACSGIQIVDIAFGDTFADIEKRLMHNEVYTNE